MILVIKSKASEFCFKFVNLYPLCRFWLSTYGSDFRKDEKLSLLLNEFAENVDCEEEKSAIDISNV